MTDTREPQGDRPDDPASAEESKSADRVVVSYPADLSDWGRFQVEKSSFRAFLRKTRETARDGNVWEEFVGVGCCGNTLDVPLRVERTDGGSRIDAETAIEYEVRDACGVEGSWSVQSKEGPSHS
ncbi:hypothetical protein [Natrialba sp. INN-245]|uniref:hypothetical protein n=1 Tax=Natrialba sp. INN-245 TaxID=2690967 RepID=UPI0013134B87|nr:hypothetical protein [Natrialba sp. INN-245]MWV41340.1 hypothetical protein [Natrialba sp. INN-245]